MLTAQLNSIQIGVGCIKNRQIKKWHISKHFTNHTFVGMQKTFQFVESSKSLDIMKYSILFISLIYFSVYYIQIFSEADKRKLPLKTISIQSREGYGGIN